MPELVTDAFTYSNGNLATVSGGVWTTLTAYTDFVVASNKVRGAAGVECAVEITTWAGSLTDQYAQCVITNNGNPVFCGPAILSNGVDALYVFDARIGTPGSQQILKLTTGPTYTPLGSAVNHTLAAGDTVYIERQAGVLVTKINGVTVNTETDGSPLVSGKPGMRAFADGSFLDTWAAGDFAVAGGGQPTGHYDRMRRVA